MNTTDKLMNVEVDVYATGLNPITYVGQEFALETNHWFPIWVYTTVLCEDLLTEETSPEKKYKDLITVITEKNAIQMAHRILEAIKNGNAKEYGRKSFDGDKTFIFNLKNLEAFAIFCGLSGGFVLS